MTKEEAWIRIDEITKLDLRTSGLNNAIANNLQALAICLIDIKDNIERINNILDPN